MQACKHARASARSCDHEIAIDRYPIMQATQVLHVRTYAYARACVHRGRRRCHAAPPRLPVYQPLCVTVHQHQPALALAIATERS